MTTTSAGDPIGIDFGGTGTKAAPVDLVLGELSAKRKRIPTPKPSTPDAMGDVMAELVAKFPESTGPVGVTVPAVVRRGVVSSAANIDKSWIGVDADKILTKRLGRPVHVLNDADAAGYAELQYGAAKGHAGVVLVTTLGTGIGSALLYDGELVPNTELGHIEIDGHDAESRAAASAYEREDLSWEALGQATDHLLPHPREAVLPRPVRGRRRREQERRRIPAPDRHRHRDRAGAAAQQRRHRRRRRAEPPGWLIALLHAGR